jgi:hypothetical protein
MMECLKENISTVGIKIIAIGFRQSYSETEGKLRE